MKKIYLLTGWLLSGIIVTAQKFEQLAQTPPMGWNSWNTFTVNINEQLIKETADLLLSSGMKDAGYEYLVLDDGWMAKERDSITGDLVPDPVKFPNGLKPVIDYVHAKGLKFGLYNCAGTLTCGGYPGTRGYEYQDARLYAALEIDYLKFDWCYTEGLNAVEAYTTMSKAIKKAGRPIVFSICEWGSNQPWLWAKPVGHLWRTTGDIFNCFDCIKDHGTWKSWGVLSIIDMRKNIGSYAGPGHWNDLDMLEVGNGMPVNEDRAHFSMWCMLASPLMAGNDLRKMSAATKEILTNKEVVAINQDKKGIQAWLGEQKDSVDVWIKPLAGEELAICFMNRSQKPLKFLYNWKQHPIADTLSGSNIDFNKTVYSLRNCWLHSFAGNTDTALLTTIPAHDVVLFRLSKTVLYKKNNLSNHEK